MGDKPFLADFVVHEVLGVAEANMVEVKRMAIKEAVVVKVVVANSAVAMRMMTKEVVVVAKVTVVKVAVVNAEETLELPGHGQPCLHQSVSVVYGM